MYIIALQEMQDDLMLPFHEKGDPTHAGPRSYRWHQMENMHDVTGLKEQILKNMWNPQDDT